MSQFEKLIAELAPGGVPFKTLGEVLRIRNGKDHKSLDDGDIPVYGSGGIMRYVDTAAADGPSVLIPRKGSLGNVFYVDGPFWVVDTIFRTEVDSTQVDPKFVYHQLLTMKLGGMNQAGGVPSQTQAVLNSLRIPVPPLAIQREIVRTLDQFSALIGALESEIKERRAQRTALAVNFAVTSRDVEAGQHAVSRVNLGALAREVVDPIRVHPEKSYVNLGVKWNGEGVLTREPRSGAEIKATTLYGVRPGQLVYNRMFVVEGSFALIPPESAGAVVSNEFPVFDIDSSVVEPEWLLHYLCDPYTLARIEAEVTGTERGTMKSRRRWKQDQFARFVVEMPTLERQREILRVVRACDDLIRSLHDELDARRRQYEYYRDQILTFPEASA